MCPTVAPEGYFCNTGEASVVLAEMKKKWWTFERFMKGQMIKLVMF